MTQQDFQKIFEANFTPLRNYLFYRCGNPEWATDLAQESFLKIWEKRDSIDLKRVKGLIYKIANDLFISQYRKEKRSFEFFDHYELDDQQHSPEDKMMAQQLKQGYQQALGNMDEKQRTVFLLSRAEELTYKEISERVGISVKAVEKRMNKALNYLRKSLKINGE